MNKRSERAASISAALLLQAGFLLLLLEALHVAPLRRIAAREFTLILPRLKPAPLPTPASAPRATGIPSRVRPLVIPLSPPPSSAIPLVPPSAIQGFGQALNNCAPEAYGNLSAEQKAKCIRPGEGVAVEEAPNLMGVPSQVKDPARWANALAHEKSPPWLPCAGTSATPVAPGGGDGPQGGASMLLDPLCLLQKFADGSLSDPMRWPAYQVKQWAPEDFFQIEQTYRQWHADHAKAAAK